MKPQGNLKSISAIIVEDQEMFGLLVQHSVFESNGISCVARCATAREAKSKIFAEKPDVVLLDNQLPDGRGIDIFEEAQAHVPNTHWILCTAVNAPALIREAVRAGIQGVVLKSSPPESILTAIREVMRGNDFFCPATTRLLTLNSTNQNPAHLSERENEALQHLANGLSTKEIADIMALSQKTVNLHVKSSCGKLQATSYIDAVNKARIRGLV